MINKVELIDCMEYMKDVPDNAFELAIVDPPYSVGASDGMFGARKTGKHSSQFSGLKKYANHNTPPSKNYFIELFRISKNQIIWGANYYPMYLYHSGWIVWDKLTTGPLSDCELAFQSFNKLVTKYTSGWSGFVKHDEGDHSKVRIHPNQKPVSLYKWLLTTYAKQGDKILDTHIGSGSIRIACHDMGFDLQGCELDPDYYAAQEDRYQNHIAQKSLFNNDEIQDLIYKGKE